MGTTTVHVPKFRGVHKDSGATLIPWFGTDPNAQFNCFSWVLITNETNNQDDEGKWKYERVNKNWTHKKGNFHKTHFRPTSVK